MAELFSPEIRRNYAITNREIKDIVITIFALGFIFSYSKWPNLSQGIINFLIYSVLAGISFIIHIYAHKRYAKSIETKTEYFLSSEFLFLAIILVILTGGLFTLPILGTMTIGTLYSIRIGYKHPGITRRHVGKVALAGPVANIAFAIILKFFAGFNPLILELMKMNLWIALFNLIPIPPFDGSKVLMAARGGLGAILVFTALLFFTLPNYGAVAAVILSIVLAIIIGLVYLVPGLAK